MPILRNTIKFLGLIALSLFFFTASQAMTYKVISKDEISDKIMQLKKTELVKIFTAKLQGKEVAIHQWKKASFPQSLDALNSKAKGHPHIVAVLGRLNIEHEIALVMEFAVPLDSFYKKYPLSDENIYNFAEQIIQGLCFMDEAGFSHKNLNTKSIVVAGDLTLKVADFGLAELKELREAEDSLGWKAPEVVRMQSEGKMPNLEGQKMANMYSYGVILWSMKTRHKPFQDMDDAQVLLALSHGKKEEIDPSWPEHFQELVSDLWASTPTDRPKSSEILKRFLLPIFKINSARCARVEGYKREF